jgi:hypothetical protein
MGSLQSELQRIAAEAEPNRGKRRKVEADNAQRDAMTWQASARYWRRRGSHEPSRDDTLCRIANATTRRVVSANQREASSRARQEWRPSLR